jgi:hypothetical protein
MASSWVNGRDDQVGLVEGEALGVERVVLDAADSVGV